MTQRASQGEDPAGRRGSNESRRRTAMSARDVAILRSLSDRIDPADAGAHNNLGVVFFQKGLHEDALSAFERALQLDPRLEVARTNVRIAYERSGQYRRRVEDLRGRVLRSPGDVEARDALARTFLLGGDPDAAAREWRVLLSDNAESLPLHMKLAHAEAERGRAGEAERLLARAAELAPDEPAVHQQLAELHHGLGAPRRALQSARRAAAMAPDDARTQDLLARIFDTLDRPAHAEEARQRAAALDPSVLESEHHLSLERYFSITAARSDQKPESVDGRLGRYARAGELRRRGDFEGAFRELEQALSDGEDALEVREAMAELRLVRGDPATAARDYESLLEERPDSPKLWNERGVAMHRSGEASEATRAYRRAVAIDHGYALAWNNLGVALSQNGDSGGAERAFRKAAETDPPPEVLWNLGLFLGREKRPEEAVDACRAAVEADEGAAESWTRLGSALFQAERLPESRDALLRALDLDAEHAEARYQLGFVLSALGDFPGALRETKRALELDPLFPAPRFRLLIDVQFEASSLPAPDTEGEQVRPGTEVTAFQPDNAAFDRAFAGLALPGGERPAAFAEAIREGQVALRRGQARRAAELAGRALAEAPDAAEALLLQGRAQLSMGLAGEALERFEAVLRTAAGPGGEAEIAAARRGKARCLLVLERPEDAAAAVMGAEDTESLVLRGRALLAAGAAKAAVDTLEAALAAGSTGSPLLTALGEALVADGRPADAEPYFRSALDQEPAAVAARTGLGRALAALGDDAGAEAAYQAAVAALPSYAEAVLRLAELRWRAGRRPAALRGLIEFLQLDPTHADALARLGTWLYELGRPEQARTALQRALRFAPDHAAARAELERVGTEEPVDAD